MLPFLAPVAKAAAQALNVIAVVNSAPVAVVAAGTSLIVSSALKSLFEESLGTREALHSWETAKETAERELIKRQQEIDLQLKRRRQEYDFQVLVDLHLSCLSAQNTANQVFQDSLEIISRVEEMSKELSQERESLKCNQHSSEQLKLIEESTSALSEISNKLYQEKSELLRNLEEANKRTRAVEFAIRDNFGDKGKTWYAQLKPSN